MAFPCFWNGDGDGVMVMVKEEVIAPRRTINLDPAL